MAHSNLTGWSGVKCDGLGEGLAAAGIQQGKDQALLAPNETQAAVRLEGDPSVWIADLERGTLQRLVETEAPAETVVLFFSQDGQRVAYRARCARGRLEVVRPPIDGR